MLSRLLLSLSLPVTAIRAQVPDFYDMDTVRDVYLTFSQPNYWSLMLNNYTTRTNIAADMTVDGRTYPDVGVRFRGNTSYTMLPAGSEKRSINVELDWIVPDQEIYGYDSLNFNNGFHDPTFLREVMTYYTMRRHGVAPKANWIRLWLNGQYWGIYINVQQPNRDMMREWFRSDRGNRYRCFPVSGGFSNGRCAYTVLNPNTVANYLTAYEAKRGDGLDLMQMIAVLNSTTTATPQTTLTSVFNVDSFYRYVAVMNVTTNTDSYLQSGKDHFLYMDDVHGDATTFPFDLNEAMKGSTTLAPILQHDAVDPAWLHPHAAVPGLDGTLQGASARSRRRNLQSNAPDTVVPAVSRNADARCPRRHKEAVHLSAVPKQPHCVDHDQRRQPVWRQHHRARPVAVPECALPVPQHAFLPQRGASELE